jgi:glycine cleavage system H protein
MANYPANLKYTRDHEWARREGKTLVVGVTFHAQDALGDVVYVELPKVGAQVTAGQPFGVVESTKAVNELFSPVTGKVTRVNDALSGAPQTLNQDPYGNGWMLEIEPSDPSQYDALLDAQAYEELLKKS